MSRSKSNRNTAYRFGVVTFLDILGFKELIGNRKPDEIAQIVDLVQRFAAETDEDIAKKFGDDANFTKAVSFSDSVIRFRPADGRYQDGTLFHELNSLVHAQADLANLGVFVRGGVAIGDFHLDGCALFGPAMVRAYELESFYAIFPRIIVAPEALVCFREDPRLRADHHDLADEIHYLKKLLRRSDDGLWFVDYLKSILPEMDEPDEYPDLVSSHRELIIERARASEKSPKVLHKYLWLANYHNTVCREMFKGSDLTKMLISKDEFIWFEDFPEHSPNIR